MSDSNQVVTVDMYHPDTPDYCFLPPPSIEHPFENCMDNGWVASFKNLPCSTKEEWVTFRLTRHHDLGQTEYTLEGEAAKAARESVYEGDPFKKWAKHDAVNVSFTRTGENVYERRAPTNKPFEDHPDITTPHELDMIVAYNNLGQ